MSTFQNKPFPCVALYRTSWAGKMTFEQFHDDLAHYAAAFERIPFALQHESEQRIQQWMTGTAAPCAPACGVGPDKWLLELIEQV